MVILGRRKFKANGLCLYCKKLVKEVQIKTKVERRKEIVKTSEVINEIEQRPPTAKINGTKHCFFENINKIDMLLTKLRKKEGKHKILISRMKEGP